MLSRGRGWEGAFHGREGCGASGLRFLSATMGGGLCPVCPFPPWQGLDAHVPGAPREQEPGPALPGVPAQGRVLSVGMSRPRAPAGLMQPPGPLLTHDCCDCHTTTGTQRGAGAGLLRGLGCRMGLGGDRGCGGRRAVAELVHRAGLDVAGAGVQGSPLPIPAWLWAEAQAGGARLGGDAPSPAAASATARAPAVR